MIVFRSVGIYCWLFSLYQFKKKKIFELFMRNCFILCKKEKVNPKKQVSERSEVWVISRNLGSSFIRTLLLNAYQIAKAIFICFTKEDKSETMAAFRITIECNPLSLSIRRLQWSNSRIKYIGSLPLLSCFYGENQSL